MQAVVRIGATQYLVEPGQEVMVDHMPKVEKNLVLDQVLMVIDGADVQVGQPYVTGVTVKATYLNDKKGEKIRVAKFKAKSRYRKAVGSRSINTLLKIDSIGEVAAEAPKVEAKSAPKEEVKATPKAEKKPRAKKTV